VFFLGVVRTVLVVSVAVEHRITMIADVITIYVGKGSARILVKFYFVIRQLLLHYVGEGHRDTAANIWRSGCAPADVRGVA